MGQDREQKQMCFFQIDLIGIVAKPAILVTCLKIPPGNMQNHVSSLQSVTYIMVPKDSSKVRDTPVKGSQLQNNFARAHC